MAQKKKLSLLFLVLMLAPLACGPLQQSTVTSVPSSTSPVIPTILPTSTIAATPIQIATSASSATFIPVPSATATPTTVSILPFRGVTSLSGLPMDASGEVQLHVLANDSVWIISSQAAMHWEGRDWKIALSTSKYMQAAVDDGGQLWVLYPDISDISALHGEDWIIYGAGKGWVSAAGFEKNWWAPEPWNVYNGAGGMLWTPMERDVRTFDGNRWNLYTLDDMSFPPQEDVDISIVHNLALVNGGAEVWVGECYYSGPGPMGGGGVRWLDGQTWHGMDAPVSSRCVSALTVDQLGNLWLGASENVWRYEHTSQSWTEYSLPAALLSDFNFTHPRQIIVDQVGDVWVGEQMCGGASCDVLAHLYRIHNGEWSLIIDALYWASSFKQLVLDGNGQGWLFWEGMFYRLDGDLLEPISSIAARGVDVSPDGSIWVVAGIGDEASLQVLEP